MVLRVRRRPLLEDALVADALVVGRAYLRTAARLRGGGGGKCQVNFWDTGSGITTLARREVVVVGAREAQAALPGKMVARGRKCS